ncbi:MAG TPA: flagellar hook-basal body complex protein FliE [Rhodanobacteraceae bacterium]|nr:flagellar hook-basal body complex protein FliE [Rhodanobacteraceae bacterium]
MNTIDVNGLLSQMRALSEQARLQPRAPVAAPASIGGKPVDFGSLLKKSIDGVASSQNSANALADRFERGDPGTDIGSVMVALQRADLSFRAVTEVRNKLVDAYKDIMNMQV